MIYLPKVIRYYARRLLWAFSVFLACAGVAFFAFKVFGCIPIRATKEAPRTTTRTATDQRGETRGEGSPVTNVSVVWNWTRVGGASFVAVGVAALAFLSYLRSRALSRVMDSVEFGRRRGLISEVVVDRIRTHDDAVEALIRRYAKKMPRYARGGAEHESTGVP